MNLSTRNLSTRGLFLISRLQLLNINGVSSVSSSEIHIPMRKERGPTDILRALEKTIKRDPTAPQYKYHDDPYLIPISSRQKRAYALAQEAGRKAAMWIREQHSNLFQHKVADPVIDSFLPKAVYNDEAKVSEEILKNVIKDGHISDALTIYKLLQENTSIETKCELLQLLCFYNNEEPLSEELINERWLKTVYQRPTWRNCPDTDKLFMYLKNQDILIATEAYNAMMCGYAKFYNEQKVWQLFEEAKKKNLPLSVKAYNALILTVPLVRDTTEERYNLLIELFQKMKNYKVQPDIGTFNSALKTAVSIRNRTVSENLCRSLFAEFKHLGIEPSLASYNYALQIFYRKDSPRNSLLNEIITKLENTSFIIRDKFDLYFFMNAMEIASTILEDAVLGDRIHKLLMHADNYNFIGDNFKQSIYYRHYLILQVRNQALDEFVKNYYDLIVPHIYTAEPSVMDAILNAVEANDVEVSKTLLPKFWTHIVQFDHLEKRSLIAKALNLMRTHCKPDKNSPINKIYADAGWTVWDYVMNRQIQRIQEVTWTATILCDIAILYYRADEIEKCASIIEYLFDKRQQIIGVPEKSQVEELFKSFITDCHIEPIVDLVHYCSEVGYEDTTSMIVQVFNNLSLNEWQTNRLKGLVNPETIPNAV
ncbi:protein PTCD3 homolog, mitochondrial [Chelonus insularis]|uniref:protein PTCD3 homolog, mitochondrial n=1 Tax=Chelonus insularis TaxID=460826 RepID=UPI00158F4A83|nr:protein PTCD3 homolog, mitochondrial [Chelonus insularis]